MNELIKIDAPEFTGIELSKAQQIKAVFDPMSEMLLQFEEKYSEIIAESESGITEDITKRAKLLRLDIGKVRISTEKTRKEQKEEYLRAGKAIDGVANIIKWAVSDKETKLQEIETHFETLEKQRIETLQNERAELIAEYLDEVPNDLGTMKDEVFDAYLAMLKKKHEDRIEAEAKAEAERIENERLDKIASERLQLILPLKKYWEEEGYNLRDMDQGTFDFIMNSLSDAKVADEKELARIKAENERLQKEKEAAEKKAAAERAKVEAEKKAAEEKARKEKEEIERKAAEERRIAAEKAAEVERKHKEEQRIAAEKQAAIEAELKAKKDAEEKAKRDKEAAEKKAARAPDKDKIASFIDFLCLVQYPTVKSKEAQQIVEYAHNKIIELISTLKQQNDRM